MADTYTKFPEGIDTFEDNADLDSGHAAAAAQYTKYLADGKYTEASNYLNQNSSLRKYIIKAADINHETCDYCTGTALCRSGELHH